MPRRSRTTIAALLVLIAIAIAPLQAFAAPAATRTVSHDTIAWTLPAEQCPDIVETISGVGDRSTTIVTTARGDGSTQIVINELVRGTASDSTGSYHFVYANHSTQVVPADGSAITVHMTDNFALNGNGSTKRLTVGFNWTWTFEQGGAMWPPQDNWVQISTRGDPLRCDPI